MSDDVEQTQQLATVLVGGFPTAVLSRDELAATMVSDCLEARTDRGRLPKLVFSSNGQGIALAGRDEVFAETMGEADIVHADGMPVVFASRLTGTPLPERICTTDFFRDAAEVASTHNLRFFFLGAREEQNAAAVAAVKKMYPGIEVVGRHHGYFPAAEDEVVCREIRDSQADVVWVAMGKPHQEHWCVRNREQLRGIGWLKTCGGLYSFLVGDAPRAPAWVSSIGLEWLHRAIDDPKRLAWRYVSTNPYALYRLLRYTERTLKY